ncbi:Plasma membrane sulfite pump involved in sulfite metabolism, partial [Tulasnella sp. JGI-2019a]
MATTPRPTSSNVATPVIPNKEEEDRVKGLTGRIKHFSPSWFSVTMGTGIPCTLILNLPYPEAVHRLRIPATMFLVLDTILFAAFTITIATRYIRFPEIWRLTWTHESHSLYIGTIPMSLFTLISGWIGVSQAYGWGDSWLWAMSVCWWLSCLVSIAIAFTVPFLAFTTHRNLPETMTAALLLPVVPNITAAAIGGVLASHFVDISPSYCMHI